MKVLLLNRHMLDQNYDCVSLSIKFINRAITYFSFQMRFSDTYVSAAIPEWRKCYLNYCHLKIFIKILRRISFLLSHLRHIRNQLDFVNDYESIVSSHINQSTRRKIDLLDDFDTDLREKAHRVNALFYEAHNKGMKIAKLFIHMKLIQLHNRHKYCAEMDLISADEKLKSHFERLISFYQTQTNLLEKMKYDNKEAQQHILFKHKKYAHKIVPTPDPINEINRLSIQLKKDRVAFEDCHSHFTQAKRRGHKFYVKVMGLDKKEKPMYFFGVWIGSSVSIIIVLIIILALSNKSFESDPIFNRDFPTWRGIAYFIFYIWIIGLNTYIYQQYNVSYQLIFHPNQESSTNSSSYFMIAALFSTIYLIFFIIYTLELVSIIKIGFLAPYYLVLFVWGFFILFWINPLPIFAWRSRLYVFKLILMALISPFNGVTFEIGWFTDQLVSLITPFKDMVYTICYYINIQTLKKNQTLVEQCSQSLSIEVILAVGAITYFYRSAQCIRQGYDNGKYLLTPQFFNTIKYLCSLITLVISFLHKTVSTQLFPAWLIFAIISTFYSYIWDLKMDWMLLEFDSPKKLLRPNLTYHPYQFYYVIMVFNLALRLSWLLTLSPSVVSTFGSPQIFALVTGAAEILRRGIWNILRVQKEHLLNCMTFQAVPKTPDYIEHELIEKIREMAEKQDFRFHEDFRKFLINREKSKINNEKFFNLVREQIAREQTSRKQRQKKAKLIEFELGKLNKEMQKRILFDFEDQQEDRLTVVSKKK